MDFAEVISIFISVKLPIAMIDGLVLIAPGGQTVTDVILVDAN